MKPCEDCGRDKKRAGRFCSRCYQRYYRADPVRRRRHRQAVSAYAKANPDKRRRWVATSRARRTHRIITRQIGTVVVISEQLLTAAADAKALRRMVLLHLHRDARRIHGGRWPWRTFGKPYSVMMSHVTPWDQTRQVVAKWNKVVALWRDKK
jgi:hypothetical protein